MVATSHWKIWISGSLLICSPAEHCLVLQIPCLFGQKGVTEKGACRSCSRDNRTEELKTKFCFCIMGRRLGIGRVLVRCRTARSFLLICDSLQDGQHCPFFAALYFPEGSWRPLVGLHSSAWFRPTGGGATFAEGLDCHMQYFLTSSSTWCSQKSSSKPLFWP